MPLKIAITALSSISSLGHQSQDVLTNYNSHKTHIKSQTIGNTPELGGFLPKTAKAVLDRLKNSNEKYKNLDPSVLMAIYCGRELIKQTQWQPNYNVGINIGSSRGATTLFEKYYEDFLKHKQSSTLASPTTTLGNISSWVANDLQVAGPNLSHSITCSTALHAVLNGVAWLQANMADAFIVGGSEAPLTPFTIAQMKALKIYAQHPQEYPCRALDFNKTQNTMVIGEGAGLIALEKGEHKNALGYITGIGYATEILEHNISISSNADCFQKSMKMAIAHLNPNEIDAIVMHAPGTLKGDEAEFNAITAVFGEEIPQITSNKWKIGHTFGASGILSVEMALTMLKTQKFVSVPFANTKTNNKPLKNILVNAVGFGGNAVSIVISRKSFR